MKEKTRLDFLLLEKGLADSRHQAQGLILGGKVKVLGFLQTKPGTFLPSNTPIELAAPPPYVGRGGTKLEHALEEFGVSPAHKICLDVGASTGGFTDCLLQRGAKKVYAVDVGRGQLAWKLRNDPRVICFEKTNARFLSKKEITEAIDLFVMDVSFISVKKVLPAVKSLSAKENEGIILIKPQFEAGRKNVKKGIVKEKSIHAEVLKDFLDWAGRHEFFPKRLTASPITGADGNIEFFVHVDNRCRITGASEQDITRIVQEAHEKSSKTP